LIDPVNELINQTDILFDSTTYVQFCTFFISSSFGPIGKGKRPPLGQISPSHENVRGILVLQLIVTHCNRETNLSII